MDMLTLTRPDDWHVHLRDGPILATTVPDVAHRFARAIVMPNLQPPVTGWVAAQAYRERIAAHIPDGCRFEPLMTIYLTDRTELAEIQRAREKGIAAAKLYPAGATTNAEAGVTSIDAIHPVLEAMESCNLPLLVHGEVTTPGVDIFDREAVFIEEVLAPLVERYRGLRIVLEHITTRAAVDFVRSSPPTVAATITPHHLLLNRNDLLVGAIRPHHYCLPVLKRERDREALLEAATSGETRFFLGTDSAPHARGAKETACGCAGIYSAHAAIELYAEAFEQAGALNRLEGFAAHFGADFYGLPRNNDRITLRREARQIPPHYSCGDELLVPLRASGTVAWTLVET